MARRFPWQRDREPAPTISFNRPAAWRDLQGAPPRLPEELARHEPASRRVTAPIDFAAPEPPRPEPAPKPKPAKTERRRPDESAKYRYLGPEEEPSDGAWTAAVIIGLAIALTIWFIVAGGDKETSSPTTPFGDSNTRPSASTDVTVDWLRTAAELRPELAEPEFEIHHDGFMDSSTVIDADQVWAVLTINPEGLAGRLHGLDPDTGDELWHRGMEGSFCAEDLLEGQLACAEALERESTLGTKWRLHLIDPATGESNVEAVIDAWIAAMVVHHDRLVIVEQRQPAPHAVARGFRPDLSEVWQHDLSEYVGHEDMFSTNRLWIRSERVPEGWPALIRPRVRLVADGVTALWIGSRTAFIDARTGEMLGLPFCSRLVDDGARLWCNVGPQAVAYDYSLRQLYATEEGIRLAFPDIDRYYGDTSPPVFTRESGELVKVDLTTGESRGRLVKLGVGDAFGMAIPPSVAYAGGHLLAGDSEQTVRINPETGEVLWRQKWKTDLDRLFFADDTPISAEYQTVMLDPATGDTVNQVRVSPGIYVSRVGEGFATSGLDDVARIQLP